MTALLSVLLDVDRWDSADDDAQDAVIADVARVLEDAACFEWVRTQRFEGQQLRPRLETCPSCQGMGGRSPQSGNTDLPDCDTCDNSHEVTVYDPGSLASHRVAVFRHRTIQTEFVLVPGRMDIAACLVARDPVEPLPAEPRTTDAGLRKLSPAETRHVVERGGAFDLGWDKGVWNEHPFGLRRTDAESVASKLDRFAFTIASLEAAQAAAVHEIADQLGPIDKAVPRGCFSRTGCGTADPPRTEPSTIAFSRDGRWIATAHHNNGREVRVWDVEKGRPLACLSLSPAIEQHSSNRVNSIAFSPDNVRLVAATNGDLEVFELTGQSLAKLGNGLPLTRMPTEKAGFFPARIAHWLVDGRLLVAEVTKDKDVYLSLIHPDTGELEKSSEWKLVRSLYGINLATSFDGSFSDDGALYAAVSIPYDEAIAIWDIRRWEIVTRIPIDAGDTVDSVAIGGNLLFVSSIIRGGGLRAYEMATGRAVIHAEDGSKNIAELASSEIFASPDGVRVAANHYGGVGIYNMKSRKLKVCGPKSSTGAIAFSPKGTLCATGVRDQVFAALWPVR